MTTRVGQQLTAQAQSDRESFEAKYGYLGNCSCHLHPPCGSCLHPGNPANQGESDECWEADSEMGAPQSSDITAAFTDIARPVLDEIGIERERQKLVEGYSDAIDDACTKGQLAWMACGFAMTAATVQSHVNFEMTPEAYAALPMPPHFPHPNRWKPKTVRRDLIRAAALIIAEIDRLDRAAAKAQAVPS